MKIAAIAAAAALLAAGAVYVGIRARAAAPAVAPDTTLRVASSDLKRTIVVATDGARIPDGENVLWCASFQLAWDAYRRDLLGGSPLQLGPPAPTDEVAALNGEPFPPGALDASAFVAMAGRGRDGIEGRFQDALAAKFGEEARGLDLPSLLPDDLAAFAVLVKDLPFEHSFDEYGSLKFEGSERAVRAFGMSRHSGGPDKRAVLDQLRIHMADAANPDRPEGFVIEISVRGGRDRLLLARVDPAPTLRETWERVRDAARESGEAPDEDTVLAIPKLNFDITHRFTELEGKPPALLAAFERTRFRLDETGARLESYAYMVARESVDRAFLFDHPFLLALVQKGATRPYLLLWIGNDELLTPE